MKSEDKPINLTDHAKRRARSRFELNEEELQLLAEEAFKKGFRLKYGRISFGGIFFVFSEKPNCHLLVTIHKGHMHKIN